MDPDTRTWDEVKRLLFEAQRSLPAGEISRGHSAIPDGPLRDTLDEFEEFLNHNELELAWDALVGVAERVGAPVVCWRVLAQAAALMRLPAKEKLAAQRAKQAPGNGAHTGYSEREE